ncbi:MAG TPA: CaiB/BaiF CoA-transferase family protein, partial [Candidatus Deferrimicrobium sp.]|nr:CaiB/BaiF CoA-transferase family protein [Candidatus Deferrimicrobium sp.]
MGPLAGLKIIEIAGIGPGPYAAMLLADLGADVVRVDRPGAVSMNAEKDVLNRGRPSIAVDLKSPDGVETVLRLVEQADALIEGFRPGVMERLGLGPDACAERNPRLVYGRMTGWGQEGPLAQTAGHDTNYIAVAGVLHNFARLGERPVPPLNLAGDFGGGSMFLVMGVLAALLHAQRTGEGQVVDAAMIDGAASLMTMEWAFRAMGIWDTEAPGTNLLDTGAPFYEVYECADGKWLAVGAIEAHFYAQLLEGMGLAGAADLPHQMDRSQWPAMKQRFAEVFRSKTRDDWWAIFQGTDACVTPVLSPSEAIDDPHIKARGTLTNEWGVDQPAPAPRFSLTPAELLRPPSAP